MLRTHACNWVKSKISDEFSVHACLGSVLSLITKTRNSFLGNQNILSSALSQCAVKNKAVINKAKQGTIANSVTCFPQQV